MMMKTRGGRSGKSNQIENVIIINCKSVHIRIKWDESLSYTPTGPTIDPNEMEKRYKFICYSVACKLEKFYMRNRISFFVLLDLPGRTCAEWLNFLGANKNCVAYLRVFESHRKREKKKENKKHEIEEKTSTTTTHRQNNSSENKIENQMRKMGNVRGELKTPSCTAICNRKRR